MQRQMQERIDGAAFRREVAIEIALRVVEQGLMLGMQQDDLHRGAFQALQSRLRTVLAPGFEEEAADVSTRRGEHGLVCRPTAVSADTSPDISSGRGISAGGHSS